MAEAAQLEERVVEVNDPALSADANRRLTEAVRATLGTDRVQVPADRPYVSRGEKPRVAWYDDMSIFKAAITGSIAVAIGVGLIILLTAAHWYLLVIAFAVLLVALASVTRTIIGLASMTEYPDPFLVALLGEQGMRDPEARFTALVAEFTPPVNGEHRTAAVEDDPLTAAAEQKQAITPAGGPSSAGGPGSS